MFTYLKILVRYPLARRDPLLYLSGAWGLVWDRWTGLACEKVGTTLPGRGMHHEPSRVVQRLLSLPGHTLGVPNQSSSRFFLRKSPSVERTPPWITLVVLTEMHHDEFRPPSLGVAFLAILLACKALAATGASCKANSASI